MAHETPPKLAEGHKANFHTLLRACSRNDLALVSALRTADKQAVALVCAMQRNADGTIMPVPLAEMINDNPFELYDDPCGESGETKAEAAAGE